MTHREGSGRVLDAVVVGAGFAGLYLLYRLRKAGFSAIALEEGGDVGGTWYWNRYPGARCDVVSVEYSYSFDDALQQEWNWSERYAGQPEILAYLRHVTERFDLRRDIRFDTRVEAAIYDAERKRWTVTAGNGVEVSARFCIMATGCLSASRVPDLPGLSQFAGPILHTGRWPHHGVDFSGRSVAVIGTGSSSIQAIPLIAQQAAQVTVLQRTPNYSIPARNVPLTATDLARVKAEYPQRRAAARATRSGVLFDYGPMSALDVSEAERHQEFERRWKIGGTNFMYSYTDLVRNEQANHCAAQFVRDKIRALVHDPEVARKLTPAGYPIGTKRICVDTDYFETFNRSNVQLVNLLEEPISTLTAHAVETSRKRYPADILVCATGYDAMTGALLAMNIRTSDGASLGEAWATGPRTYLGVAVAGFPNLFTVTGPGSPSVLSNVIVSIEHHVEWIVDCMRYLGDQKASVIEATPDAQNAWGAHVNEVASVTLFAKANSWYMGANIPGKPRVFMPYVGGLNVYQEKCREIANAGYPGFAIH